MPHKLYTRTGDKGETFLSGSKRVLKSSLRVSACGEIDELNSFIGWVRVELSNSHKEVDKTLERIQRDLFIMGSDISHHGNTKIETVHVRGLEKDIDQIAEELKSINKFILPGRSEIASRLHIARAVCRRCERTLVALSKKEEVNENILSYLNRLSSLLYTLARVVNQREDIEENIWNRGKDNIHKQQ